jgi:hypothetical protein
MATQPASTTQSGDTYAALETFCLFTGYPRSGHSVFGAMLDAHPDMAIAFEEDSIRDFEDGLSRTEIFDKVIENVERQVSKNRQSQGYSYAVPGQWQGRNRALRVIGDKHGHHVASQYDKDPAILERFEAQVELPLRIVHVTRNPYDVVARMTTKMKRERKGGPLHWSVKNFRRLARANERLIESGAYPVLTVRHETFVAEPRRELVRACEFLGVAPEDEWLEACVSVVFESPHKSRTLVEWPKEEIDALERVIASHDFFAGYTFAD